MSDVLTVAGFLDDIERHGDAVYRGQAKAEWLVDCSAIRRFGADPTKAPIPNWLLAYTAELLNGAKKHLSWPELLGRHSELEILAHLQHQGRPPD